MKVITAALLLAIAAPAAAEPCHLSIPTAILCRDGDNAAAIYSLFSTMPGAANGKFLRQYGCGWARQALSYPATPIGRGNIPTAISGIEVMSVQLQGGYWFVASGWLAGDCRPRAHAAPTWTMPPLDK